MKILLICIFLLPLKIISQIPLFESNTDKEDSLNSTILRPEFDEYDFLITYQVNSYWTRYSSNQSILANKKNKWYYINIQKTYKKDTIYEIDYENPINVLIKKRRISKFRINKILGVLSKNRIWNLSTDSLRINSDIYITDCSSYKLEFKSKQSYRIVGCYCPYFYLEELPEIIVRQNFINCYEKLKKIRQKSKLIKKN